MLSQSKSEQFEIYSVFSPSTTADIDECVAIGDEAADCPKDSECMNHLLGYDCECGEGFKYNQENNQCESKYIPIQVIVQYEQSDFVSLSLCG